MIITFEFIFYLLPFISFINKTTMYTVFQEGGGGQQKDAKWGS